MTSTIDRRIDMSLPYSDMCQKEIEILDHCAMHGENFEDFGNELQQAAFDHFWDGTTDELEFKENCWQDGWRSYKGYVDAWNADPLSASLERGHEDFFIDAVMSGADTNAHGDGDDDQKPTLLHTAAAHGRSKAAKLLIERGMDVDDFACGQTPLLLAIENRHTETASLLLDCGADVEKRDLTERSALMYAAGDGNAVLVAKLLGRGANIHGVDSSGQNALMHASEDGHTETAGLLLDNGADVNAQDDDGNTALMHGARYGRTETVALLLHRGAEFELRNHEGQSAAVVAADHRHAETATLLRAAELAEALPPAHSDPMNRPARRHPGAREPESPAPTRSNRPRL